MSLCINPNCQNPENADHLLRCESCGSELLLEGRYRVIRLLGEGGFAKTYEVSDRSTIPKLIKVLTKNEPKPIEQFQREAQVLTRLHHPGIPQAEEYFTFFPQNSRQPVHCLVMEKIEGENLEEWLEKRENRPISEKSALDWLSQLANTLHQVHQQQLIHRDIKPSNIMLKPDGSLVLIDFGIAREITETYEQKKAAGQLTRFVSDGYSPLEQVNGRAVPQSDFFALGRTFVHLLTGIPPVDLCDQYNHDLYADEELENWRDKAPQISSQLVDFIDQLIARPIQKRPPNTQAILERLAEIEQSLYPSKISSTKPSKLTTTKNHPNIILEHTLGSFLHSEHSDPVLCVAISPDSQTLVSGSRDNLIKLWNIKTGDEIKTLTGHSEAVMSLAISPDGQTLVSGSYDQTIKIWNMATGQEIRSITEGFARVYCVAISPDNQTLFSTNHNSIMVWNLQTGDIIRTLPIHGSTIRSVAISPDGQTIVSGSDDKQIKAWSICTLTGHENAVTSLAISPDNQILVSSSSDTRIGIWDLNTKKLIRFLSGHSGAIYSVAISPDGQILASGSQDEKIKLWNLSTAEEIYSFTGHSASVNAVAFSPDGQFLVSASEDTTIKIWRIQ